MKSFLAKILTVRQTYLYYSLNLVVDPTAGILKEIQKRKEITTEYELCQRFSKELGIKIDKNRVEYIQHKYMDEYRIIVAYRLTFKELLKVNKTTYKKILSNIERLLS